MTLSPFFTTLKTSKVFTIGYGPLFTQKASSREHLKTIARYTGGKFYYSPYLDIDRTLVSIYKNLTSKYGDLLIDVKLNYAELSNNTPLLIKARVLSNYNLLEFPSIISLNASLPKASVEIAGNKTMPYGAGEYSAILRGLSNGLNKIKLKASLANCSLYGYNEINVFVGKKQSHNILFFVMFNLLLVSLILFILSSYYEHAKLFLIHARKK